MRRQSRFSHASPHHASLTAAAATLLLVMGVVAPGPAAGASPLDVCRIMLGFAQTYGSGSVHRGVDLAAPAGAAVRAPVSGTVAFVGAVPADGGGTTIAVTLETAEGDRVTLMPLARAVAKRGAAVGAGSELGILAEAGDISSAESHLHLSLRRGSVYLDPTQLLGVAPATRDNPETHPADAPQDAPDSAPSGTRAAVPPGRTGWHAASPESGAQAVRSGLPSGVTLAPKTAAGSSPSAVTVPSPATRTAQTAQAGVVVLGAGATAVDVASRTSGPRVVSPEGFDAAALLERTQRSATRYARRHVHALAIGVGALLAGIAALTPLRSREGSRSPEDAVRPEGDAVAAAAGRW